VLFADPTWLVAALPDALVCRAATKQIRIGMSLTPERGEALIELLGTGAEARELAPMLECTEEEAGEVLGELARHGVLAHSPAGPGPSEGAPLAQAILESLRLDATFPLVWTATEALSLPSGIGARNFRRALNAFIAGLDDDARLAAYSRAASTRRRVVCGDAPSPGQLERALAHAHGMRDEIAVLRLDSDANGNPGARMSVSDLGRAGEVACHRLAPVLELFPEAGPQPRPAQGFTWQAHYAVPSLRHPHAAADRWAHGSGPSPEHARRVARAEALERYATGDPSEHLVVRARGCDLDGAIPPSSQYRLSPRQYAEHPEWTPYAPDDVHLWTPAKGVTGDTPAGANGGRRWVLAETAFFPFHDPERSTATTYASSSGVAAHTDRARAAESAFRELVERDAFMWTWVQRVSRERIRGPSLPADVRRAVAELEREDLTVELINLTLELETVILCAAHGPATLHLGAGCHPDPARAAAKAVAEAAMTVDAGAGERLEASEVQGPIDHHRFYQQPDRIGDAAFLFASPEVIDLGDLTPFTGPLPERLATVGEPLVVDLSSSRTRPLRVVRGIVPELVPMSFGWDLEPMGMARLRSPKARRDGRLLGRWLAPSDGRPILPHPFG